MLPTLASFASLLSISPLVSLVMTPIPIFATILVRHSAKVAMWPMRFSSPSVVVGVFIAVVNMVVPVYGIVGAVSIAAISVGVVSVASAFSAADQHRRNKQGRNSQQFETRNRTI